MTVFQKGVFLRILVLLVLNVSCGLAASILWDEEPLWLITLFFVLIPIFISVLVLVREIKILKKKIILARKKSIQGYPIIMSILLGLTFWFSSLKQNDFEIKILILVFLFSANFLHRFGYFIYPGIKINQFGTDKNADVKKIRFSEISEIIKKESQIIVRTETKQMWVDLSKIRKVDLDAFLEVFPELDTGGK